MSGAVAGGAFGALQGARAASKLKMVICPFFRPFYFALECRPALACLTPLQSSQKMRFNQVLNGVGRHSPVWAGNLGVLSILFTLSQRGIQNYRDQEDSLNTICGASVAGALFKLVPSRPPSSLDRHSCTHFSHRLCRCTSGFKPMAMFAIGGAVIGSVAEMLFEGSSLQKMVNQSSDAKQ